MMEKPSPALFSHLRQRQELTPSSLEAAFVASFPSLHALCLSLGIDVDGDLKQWADAEGLAAVTDWLDLSTRPGVIVSHLQRVRDRTDSPLDELVREAHLSARPDELGPDFKQYRVSFADGLTKVRSDAAIALYYWGLKLGYLKPAMMLRSLELSRTYFNELIYSDRLQSKQPSAVHLHRFGTSTVISGRFEVQELVDIEEAANALLEAVQLEPDKRQAREMYLEALVQLFDATGDVLSLDRAVSFLDISEGESSSTWHLHAVDVLLPCLDDPSSHRPKDRLALAANHLRLAEQANTDAEAIARARLTMTAALLEYVRTTHATGAPSYCRGISLPFGARHRDTIDARLAETWTALIRAMLPFAQDGEFLYRDLCADLLSRRAQHFGTGEARASDLRQAIELRKGGKWQTPLSGERIQLAQAVDHLRLAALTSNPVSRASGLGILLAEAQASDFSPAALVLLAREIQEHGSFKGDLGTPASFSSRVHPFEQAIRDGDSRPLYSAAANRALRRKDVRHRDLGGRDGVWVVDEPSRLSGKTLVIKKMALCRWRADVARTSAVLEAIKDRRAFGVVEHLGSVPPEHELLDVPPSTFIRSVRQ